MEGEGEGVRRRRRRRDGVGPRSWGTTGQQRNGQPSQGKVVLVAGQVDRQGDVDADAERMGWEERRPRDLCGERRSGAGGEEEGGRAAHEGRRGGLKPSPSGSNGSGGTSGTSGRPGPKQSRA